MEFCLHSNFNVSSHAIFFFAKTNLQRCITLGWKSREGRGCEKKDSQSLVENALLAVNHTVALGAL